MHLLLPLAWNEIFAAFETIQFFFYDLKDENLRPVCKEFQLNFFARFYFVFKLFRQKEKQVSQTQCYSPVFLRFTFGIYKKRDFCNVYWALDKIVYKRIE